MTEPARSSGQEQVRNMARQWLPRYTAIPRSDGDAKTAIYQELRAALAADPAVRADAITGAHYRTHAIASTFVTLIAERGFNVRITPLPNQHLTFAWVVFAGTVAGSYGQVQQPRYHGGERWNTTMQAVLTIVAGQRVGANRPSDELQASYFPQLGLLLGYNGNHRLLAHVLTGEQRIPNLAWYTLPDAIEPWMNERLLWFELWCKEARLAYHPLLPGDQAAIIPALHQLATVTEAEHHILTAFFKQHPPSVSLSPLRADYTSLLDAYCAALDELRTLTARPYYLRMQRALQRRLGREESLLEWWLRKRTET